MPLLTLRGRLIEARNTIDQALPLAWRTGTCVLRGFAGGTGQTVVSNTNLQTTGNFFSDFPTGEMGWTVEESDLESKTSETAILLGGEIWDVESLIAVNSRESHRQK